MLAHTFGAISTYAFSKDLSEWHIAKETPYDGMFVPQKGTKAVKAFRTERPALVIEPNTGELLYLINGVMMENGAKTFTAFRPLRRHNDNEEQTNEIQDIGTALVGFS